MKVLTVFAHPGPRTFCHVYWLGFPAIMKGWVERVFTYGTAYRLTAEGWNAWTSGRVPLLHHHHYLWAVGAVGPEVRERYLEQAYALGRNFEPPLSQPVAGAVAEA